MSAQTQQAASQVRQLCFNTQTDQICLQITPLSLVQNGAAGAGAATAAAQNGVLQTQAQGAVFGPTAQRSTY